MIHNFRKIFVPGFLEKADQKMKTDRPVLRSSRLLYVLWFTVLTTAFSGIFTFLLPESAMPDTADSPIVFMLTLAVILPAAGFWIYKLWGDELLKRYPWQIRKNGRLYFLSLLAGIACFVFLPIWTHFLPDLRIKFARPAQEIAEDLHKLDMAHAFFQSQILGNEDLCEEQEKQNRSVDEQLYSYFAFYFEKWEREGVAGEAAEVNVEELKEIWCKNAAPEQQMGLIRDYLTVLEKYSGRELLKKEAKEDNSQAALFLKNAHNLPDAVNETKWKLDRILKAHKALSEDAGNSLLVGIFVALFLANMLYLSLQLSVLNVILCLAVGPFLAGASLALGFGVGQSVFGEEKAVFFFLPLCYAPLAYIGYKAASAKSYEPIGSAVLALAVFFLPLLLTFYSFAFVSEIAYNTPARTLSLFVGYLIYILLLPGINKILARNRSLVGAK